MRLWPERFTDVPSADGAKSSHVNGFYLLGLRRTSESSEEKPLTSTLQSFEDMIRRAEKYYDPSLSFVAVMKCSRKSLTAVVVDKPAWNDGGIDEELSSDEEPDEAQEIQEDPDDHDSFAHQSNATLKKHQKTSRATVTPHIPAQRLRTSTDVYNRLMWDHQLDQGDYMIGYEDRFLGIKEMVGSRINLCFVCA